MALRKAGMREIILMPALKRPLYQNGEAHGFDLEQAVIIRGSVQPLSSHMEAAVYGEKARRMLLLLTDKEMPLAEGMGVCIQNGFTEGCDYRVAAPPEVWRSHKRAVLEQTKGS